MKKDGQISGHPLKLHCFLIIIERKITKRKTLLTIDITNKIAENE